MNKKLAVIFSSAILLILPIVAFADPSVNPATWIGDIITRFLNMVVWPIFIGAAIIMFLWAGFLFLTAQGDPKKITDAKRAAIFAVVGIVIGLLGSSVVPTIRNFFGLTP